MKAVTCAKCVVVHFKTEADEMEADAEIMVQVMQAVEHLNDYGSKTLTVLRVDVVDDESVWEVDEDIIVGGAK